MTSRSYKYICISLLFLCMSFTEREESSFTFVQLCDTQLGMGGYEHDVKTFQQAVQQINALHPDFVVICGDLVHNPTDSSYTDFKKIKAGFTMPCYCAPGNHDVGNIPSDASLRYYRKTIGQDYYEFNNKGYSFVVTNSQLWKTNIEKESDKHDKWFKKVVQTKKKNPQFVIGHYPLFTVSPNEEEGYFNLPLAKRQELLDLFSKNNVIAYLFGHTHQTVMHTVGKMQLVSGETTSKNFDQNPLGFRVWEVAPDRVQQHFVALEF